MVPQPPLQGSLRWARRWAAGAAVLLGTALAACTRTGAPGPAPAPSLGTLTIATSIPATGDSTAGVPVLVKFLTLEAPIQIGWDGTAVGQAFDKWTWAPDGLSLRLHLARGIRFHDGTPLTNTLAADILRGALTPGTEGVLSMTVTSVTAENQDEVLIRTRRPEGFLLSDLSVADFSLPGKPDIGTGPFRLESRGDTTRLRSFHDYYMGRPAIEDINITKHQTQRQAYAAMLRGSADVLYDVSSDSLEFVKEQATLRTYPLTRAYYHALVLNLRLPTFASRRVRQALNTAVNRERVVAIGLRGSGIVAQGPVWPHHHAYSSNQTAFSYQPATARQLLDAEGLLAGRANGHDRMPSRFRFTCLTTRDDPRLERVALLVQQDLYNIGVDMEVELASQGEIRSRVSRGQFEAVLSEFASTRSLSFVYGFWHSPVPGAGYLNLPYASADGPLDRLRAAFKEEDVRAAVRDVQQALFDDPPAVFLAWTETTRALRSDINVPDDGSRDIIRSIRQWRPAAATPR